MHRFLPRQVSRRDVIRAAGVGAWGGVAGSFALSPLGCGRAPRPLRESGRIVVPFWYAFGDRVRKTLLDLVAQYNAHQTESVIHAVHQGDYFEALAKLRTAVAADAAPPLAHVVAEVLPYLAQAGVLEPLDAYPGAASFPWLPALDQRGAFEGAGGMPLYGIPFNRSTPIAFLNGRIFEEERVPPPETWDDLLTAARRLTRRPRNGDTRWGFEVPLSWWYWVAMVGQAGGRLVDPDGSLSLGGAAGEDALRFWQRLVQDERVMRPPPGRDYQAWQSTNESFLAGRIAMMWSSTAFVRYLEDAASFPVVAAPLPRGVRASVPTGGTFFVLLRAAPSEEKQAAWDFVRWMSEPEQTAAWSARTGYLPVTETAVAHLESRGWYTKHPNDRVAYDQLAHAAPWPWAADLFRIERDVVEPLLEDAVLTGRDAHEIMDQARDEARSSR